MTVHERWAGFWDHVDDLRQTLIRSLFVIGAGFLLSLGFYQPLFEFLVSRPAEQTAEGLTKELIQHQRIVNRTTEIRQYKLPPNARIISESASPTPPALPGPLSRVYRLAPGESLTYETSAVPPLLILGPIEGLSLVFKFCFWLSLALTAPAWGWIWLQFILPGLKPEERVALYPFLLGSIISLAAGAVLAYNVTLPLANDYLTAFNSTLGENAWTLSHYINYVSLICAGHAIAAELGLLLFILVHYHWLTTEWLISKRRYMIVAALVLGALLTPPDVVTQLLLAFPLVGLYELAILYSKWRGWHVIEFSTSP